MVRERFKILNPSLPPHNTNRPFSEGVLRTGKGILTHNASAKKNVNNKPVRYPPIRKAWRDVAPFYILSVAIPIWIGNRTGETPHLGIGCNNYCISINAIKIFFNFYCDGEIEYLKSPYYDVKASPRSGVPT